MSYLRLFALSAALVGVVACGGSGGGSSSDPATGAAPPTLSTGGISLVLGDGPLDDVAEVNIDIREVILIGADDGQVGLAVEDVGVIDLLALSNLTELIVDDDVPAGSYSKIRLLIDSMEIVEIDGDREMAMLPANGKIDLNPQGEFEIVAGEDLVIQIDIDLERSIKIVQTGNSTYKFRPVVFIDVIDQADGLRISRFVGLLSIDSDGALSLCLDVDDATEDCLPLSISEAALLLNADGETLPEIDLADGDEVNVFGALMVGLTGERTIDVDALTLGGEDSVQSIDGEVASLLLDGAFDLTVDVVTTAVTLVDTARLLDSAGSDLAEDFQIGDAAEMWGQTALIDVAPVGEFPAFLGLFDVADDGLDETSVEGVLLSVDGDQLTLLVDGSEQCVLNIGETEIQQVVDDADGADTTLITLVQLTDLIGQEPVVEVFGAQMGDCLEAEVIVVELSD
ncbi:MAG: DUF4382 domain-containing protein [Pseudomonadaceae bacterium]|nr:DUF4382 domain-containing protein [Pseudomonadaceae bacterium]